MGSGSAKASRGFQATKVFVEPSVHEFGSEGGERKGADVAPVTDRADAAVKARGGRRQCEGDGRR